MKTKHAKTKMDKDGKNAFPMAIMANRYEFYICPILAMAVYMSCKGVESGGFPAGGDQLFPSDSEDTSAVSKLYGTCMHAFLNRADIKEELGEFAKKAYLDRALPRLTGKKRGRLEETHFITAAGWALGHLRSGDSWVHDSLREIQ